MHHGIASVSRPVDSAVFSRACDAFFPSLPSYSPNAPFSRADWDLIFGDCEAVTDMGSFFALQLIEAYPDAKVLLVERDVDSWFASVDEAIFRTTWGWRAFLVIDVFGRMMGLKAGLTLRKILLGYYEARSVSEIREHAKDRFRRHYAEIRARVPTERLLEYKIEQGWEPLCEFLGKEVPDVPFPRSNKREEHLARVKGRQDMFLKMMGLKLAKKLGPLLLCAVGVWVGSRAWAATPASNKAVILDAIKEAYEAGRRSVSSII